jgi:hypothetical protein
MINAESYIRFKDLPNFQSMFGNIGNSWNNPLPNDLYIKNIPKTVFSGGGVGNTGTGLQTLFSFSFPAKSLRSNDDWFRSTVAGFFGTNDDNKRLAMGLDTNTLWDTGLIDIDGNGFLLDTLARRTDSTHVHVTTSIQIGLLNIDSGGGIISGGTKWTVVFNGAVVVQNMDTGSANGFVVTGESATATNNNVGVAEATILLNRA